MVKANRIRKQFSATVDPKILARFQEVSNQSKVPLARMLDDAMLLYIEDYEKKQRKILE
jgi:hypothetical protein